MFLYLLRKFLNISLNTCIFIYTQFVNGQKSFIHFDKFRTEDVHISDKYSFTVKKTTHKIDNIGSLRTKC